MQEDALTERPVCAPVSVFRDALPAVQLCPPGNAFYDFDVQCVGFALCVREYKVCGRGFPLGLPLQKLLDHACRQRHRSFLVVLGPELPESLLGNAGEAVAWVEIVPG